MTTTFVEKFKKNGHVFLTTVTVERTQASLGELRATRGRYWDYVGDHVTEVNQVKITLTSEAGSVHNVEYTEVVTPFGKGCVINFQHGPELEAFIPNSGKALITGCWKKYGDYRGHAISYLRANQLNPNSKAKVDHTCHAHIYAIASGKNWG